MRGRLTALRAFGLTMLVTLAAAGSASADIPVPSSLPPQTYPSSVSKQQFVRMDDGVQLGVTITFPSKDGSTPAPGQLPVVLAMTPYGRGGVCGCSNAADFATRGFVFAVADVRGTGGSQGNLNGNYFSRGRRRTDMTSSSGSARSRGRPARWGWTAARISGSRS